MSQVRCYEPGLRRKTGILKIWITMLRNIFLSRDLIIQLFKRDFLAAYKKSFLDVGWIIIMPLISIVSWVFMNAAGILKPGDVGIPYPAYVLLGSSIWSFFMGCYSFSAKTLDAGKGFILQVSFPHEALLIKQCAQNLANFSLTFIFTIIALWCFGIVPSAGIIFFPLMLVPIFFLGAGIGLVISVGAVLATEIDKMVEILLGLIIFITPVIYSSRIDNVLLQKIIKWNPLTYLVCGARDMIIYGKMEFPDRFFYSALFALFIFMFSWRLFFLSEEKVVEKITI